MKRLTQLIAARVGQLQRICIAMLQEIFDESAYARFLEQRHLPASREAYGTFIREQGEAKARHPKCC
jgi:hypothetical protein